MTSTDSLAAGVFGLPSTLVLTNTSMQAQVRVEGTGDEGASLYVRGGDSKSYWTQIARDGLLYLDRPGASTQVVDTGLHPSTEDVMLQLDAIGTTISVWAWRAGEPMPQLPLISVTDNQLSSGSPGVLIAQSTIPQNSSGTAIYRYVHVADEHITAPEPSGQAIAAIGAGLLAVGWTWNRRRTH